MDLAVITIIIQLIFLEGILSIDNAAVLGAMVAHLPDDKPIPWPQRLHFMERWSERVLGPQRQAALKVGLLGAYVGRGLMLFLAGVIAQLPWVRILGAGYLVYLAIGHFAEMYHEHMQEGDADVASVVVRGFWATVLAIEMADLAFSVDNVIAAVALSNEFWVVMLGVAIGILVMRFAATIFTRMIGWEPALASGAYLLLFAIGAELLLEELFHVHIAEYTQFAISTGILVLTIVIARSPLRRSVRLAARPLLWTFAVIQRSVALVAIPFTLLLTRKDRS